MNDLSRREAAKPSKGKMFDHKWPKKRSLNIEQMLKRMQKDEAYLFEMAFTLLNSYSDIPWKLGDENMSLLIAWVAAQMDNKRRAILAKRKPKKKKSSRR